MYLYIIAYFISAVNNLGTCFNPVNPLDRSSKKYECSKDSSNTYLFIQENFNKLNCDSQDFIGNITIATSTCDLHTDPLATTSFECSIDPVLDVPGFSTYLYLSSNNCDKYAQFDSYQIIPSKGCAPLANNSSSYIIYDSKSFFMLLFAVCLLLIIKHVILIIHVYSYS